MRRWLILVPVTVGAVASIGFSRHTATPEPGQPAPAVRVEPILQPRPELAFTVRPGDTVESACRWAAGPAWPRWRNAVSAEVDPRTLRPGMEFLSRRTASGRLASLTVVLDRRRSVVFTDRSDGIVAERAERPFQRRLVRVEGQVDSSLFAAVEAAGEKPELALALADIFRWDVDFIRDVRQGDTFVALVERLSLDGEAAGYGQVYAARYVNDGRQVEAVAFAGPDGHVGYYDASGAPLRKQFLRSPMKLSRVTSRFTTRRFHPVLKTYRPHYGVDYGAPTGTPAHVTANGTVTWVGRKGGAGNMVTVRHANGYETSYLHLSRYGPGIRRGVRVSQGQVIGYVGSTGLSTGPHLDYRVKHNGRWINPLRLASPPAKPLDEGLQQRFLPHADAVRTVLDGSPTPVGAAC